MDTITKIQEKIKNFLLKEIVVHAMMILSIVILMVISYLLGRLSVIPEKNTDHIKGFSVYLPDGQLLTENTYPSDSLSAYILGGAEKNVVPQNGPTSEERISQLEESKSAEVPIDTENRIFGSKNGSTYYTPLCKAGNRVKVENRVYFNTETDAEDEGYTRSKLCK